MPIGAESPITETMLGNGRTIHHYYIKGKQQAHKLPTPGTGR